MRSDQLKSQAKKSKAQETKGPQQDKFKERDGKIDFRGTLKELRALAKTTPYAANKAIMRAAIDALQDEGAIAKTEVKVAFGMTAPKFGMVKV